MTMVTTSALLHGITVILYAETETGRDKFNRPVYEEQAVEVDNVLVGSPSGEEILDLLNLTGRRAEYVLGIPKGDTHDWTDKKVEFFGRTFRTIGSAIEGIEDMVPMQWNKKVRCEAVNDV